MGLGDDAERAGACAASRLLRCDRIADRCARAARAHVAAGLAAGACHAGLALRGAAHPPGRTGAELLAALDLVSDDSDSAGALGCAVGRGGGVRCSPATS